MRHRQLEAFEALIRVRKLSAAQLVGAQVGRGHASAAGAEVDRARLRVGEQLFLAPCQKVVGVAARVASTRVDVIHQCLDARLMGDRGGAFPCPRL